MIAEGQTIKPLIRLPKNPDDCIEWIGSTNGDGRGVKVVAGRKRSAPRWVWETFFGPLSYDFRVIQKCGNLLCVNLFHLRAVSKDECAQLNSPLTPGDVGSIRAKAIHGGVPRDLLALEFGVSVSAIDKIVSKRRWKPQKVKAA